jgi:hypothetical protein
MTNHGSETWANLAGDISHESNQCDGPGSGNGRDEALRTAGAGAGDQRRDRAGSRGGIRRNRVGVALHLDGSARG